MSALIDQGNYKENLRVYHRYVIESKTRTNELARRSAKRTVMEYAEILLADSIFKELSKETRNEITNNWFKYKIELLTEDGNI